MRSRSWVTNGAWFFVQAPREERSVDVTVVSQAEARAYDLENLAIADSEKDGPSTRWQWAYPGDSNDKSDSLDTFKEWRGH